MDWDQIQTKWLAMTRRVRCDWPADRPIDRPTDRAGIRIHRVAGAEVPSAGIMDLQAATAVDSRPKLPAE